MSIQLNQTNDVNGTGTLSEGPSSGRCSLAQQQGLGRHPVTANRKTRVKWSRSDNVLLFECFCKSEPKKRGYRKRLHALWRQSDNVRVDLRDVSEQRLCDQVSQIKAKGWLTEIEKRRIEEKVYEIENEEDRQIESNEEGENDIETNNVDGTDVGAISVEENVSELPESLNDVTSMNVEKVLSEEEKTWKARILEYFKNRPEGELINLKAYDRNRVISGVKKLNKILPTITTKDITEDNALMYAAAFVLSEDLGKIKQRRDENSKKKEPFWKRRITKSIMQWRKDLSKLEEFQRGRKLKEKDYDYYLLRRYKLHEKGTRYICEMLRQKIRAGSVKIKRFDERNEQYRQNALFNVNQKRFYDELDGEKIPNTSPNPEEVTQFWSNIWSNNVTHEVEAEWIKEIEKDLRDINRQENINITKEDIRKCTSKMACWKAPGLDGVQGFWFKKLNSLHDRVSNHLQKCLETGNVPSWMVKGKTVLIMKDPRKGNDVGNYRPIACLPLMWKLLTGIFSEKIYDHLERSDLFVDEQKGCRKNSRGTKEQLMIDKAILKNSRRRHTNLAMSWIDYKKAYDMAPHSWINKCIDMFGISKNIGNLIKSSMKEWQTVLTCNRNTLGTVEIKRGIFQGDTLSPLLFILIMIPLSLVLRKTKLGYQMSNGSQRINHLLFMDDLKLYASNKNQLESLISTVSFFSNDIRMEFGLSKCAILELKRGRQVTTEGIDLGDEGIIREADPTGYKYLGVLQLDQILEKQMKHKIKEEYHRRVKKLCRSKLNSGNLIDGINSWAVGVVRYSAGIIAWTKEELREMDRKTRKILSLNRAVHKRSNVNRLYLPRKMGGRGLQGIENIVGAECASLCEYLHESNESMLMEARNEGVIKDTECLKDYKERIRAEHLAGWREKALHGRTYQAIEGFADPESWRWLRQGFLKKETEGMICAAQEQALRTNSVKFSIDKTVDSPICRKCKSATESVQHIISGCTPLTQTEYKLRHDRVACRLHWEVCREYGLEHAARWYEHIPHSCQENESVKLLWDMTFFTDRRLAHNRPDISIFDKRTLTWKLIDVAVPFDANILSTENTKVDRYQDLTFELERLHKTPAKVIPIVIGALGTVSSNLKPALENIGMGNTLGSIQMTAILASARILRKVLRL